MRLRSFSPASNNPAGTHQFSRRREYDLLGPSRFAAGAMPGASAVSCGSSGVRKRTLMLPRRLMAHLLLHRFSNLAMQIRIEGWQQKAADFYDLEGLLLP